MILIDTGQYSGLPLNELYLHLFYAVIDRTLSDKQTYMKNEAYKLYSRVFRIFLPNFIKIAPCNFELYRFKFKTFFFRQCRQCIMYNSIMYLDCLIMSPTNMMLEDMLFENRSPMENHEGNGYI